MAFDDDFKIYNMHLNTLNNKEMHYNIMWLQGRIYGDGLRELQPLPIF